MDLICPDCRGSLQVTSARIAVCAQHGGRFEVLFDRYAGVTPVETVCEVHARQAAVHDCVACGKHICVLCTFDLNRQAYCSDCAADQAAAQNAGSSGITTLTLSERRRPVPSEDCFDHPDNPAVARCRLCAKSICATCDFALPGGVHLCPVCVENSQSSDEVSPKRKKLSYIAIALAAWSTILFVMLFAGAFNSLFTDDPAGNAADMIITNLTLWPLLIGTGLSMSAIDRRLKNTGLMKLAVWWNGILAAIFLLILIAANFGAFG